MINRKKKKIIFLVSEDKFYIHDFLKVISKDKRVNIKLVIIQKYKETLLRKIIFAILFGLFNSIKLFYILSIIRSTLSIEKLCNENNIKVVVTDNLNNLKNIKIIKSTKSDLIINLNVMKLINKKFLKKINFKLINFHPGILPKYRGLYSTFHKIINQEKYFGVSSHFMAEKIDSGPIISIIKKKIDGKSLFDCYSIIYKKLIFDLFNKTLKNHKKNLFYKKKNNYMIYKTPDFFQILKYKIITF